MLITFSCEVYNNITMFGDIAKQLLIMMGQSGTVPGAIIAKDIDEALEKLQSALNRDPKLAGKNEDEEGEPIVSLTHRALPLINMLKAAKEHECNIIWE